MSSLDSAASGAEHPKPAGQVENAWQEVARRQKETGMARLDDLAYDPERLACTGEEKETCLETVRKLVRLSYEIRRSGALAPAILAEKEEDPFLRACMLEFDCDEGYIELVDMPARLERVYAAYLAAGNYRGGAFLNAVIAAKGMLLLFRYMDAHPTVQGALLSVELRGFFGVDYRERVVIAIKREIRAHEPQRETSLVPAFDGLAQLSIERRRQILQNVGPYTLLLWPCGGRARRWRTRCLRPWRRNSASAWSWIGITAPAKRCPCLNWRSNAPSAKSLGWEDLAAKERLYE